MPWFPEHEAPSRLLPVLGGICDERFGGFPEKEENHSLRIVGRALLAANGAAVVSNFEQNRWNPACISERYGYKQHSALHPPGPAQLSLLQEHGYELLTATNGHEGLRLFMSHPVDAIVLDYQVGVIGWRGGGGCDQERETQVPIVMLAGGEDLPDDDLQARRARGKADGPISLLETIHSV